MMCAEMAYLFTRSIAAPLKFGGSISNLIPHIVIGVITYPWQLVIPIIVMRFAIIYPWDTTKCVLFHESFPHSVEQP